MVSCNQSEFFFNDLLALNQMLFPRATLHYKLNINCNQKSSQKYSRGMKKSIVIQITRVGQKIHLSFSQTVLEKPKGTFWPH